MCLYPIFLLLCKNESKLIPCANTICKVYIVHLKFRTYIVHFALLYGYILCFLDFPPAVQ